MMTVKHMQRLWRAGRFGKLLADVTEGRGGPTWDAMAARGGRPAAAAACLVRLDDLGQGHVAFAGEQRAALADAQQPGGDWGDAALTAACVRALSTRAGPGDAARRGLAALADAQRADGAWSATLIKRLPGDVDATLAVVEHLTHVPLVADRPSLDGAFDWLAKAALTQPQRRTLAHLDARRRYALQPAAGLWS